MSEKAKKYRFVKRFLANKEESDSDSTESIILLSDNTSSSNEVNTQLTNIVNNSDSSSDSSLSFVFEESGDLEASNTKTLELNYNGKSNVLENQNQNLLADNLKGWALTHNVNHKQLRSLLSILKPHHPDLPLDSRTLLGNIRSSSITPMQSQSGTNGEFIYFGIQQNLEQQLFTGGLNNILKERNITSIDLKCNIDGLKIYKSTNIDFWPILAAVHIENLNCDPFVVAIYAGDSKPKILDNFLKDFIQEIEHISVTGITGPDSQLYTFSLKYLVCDAPARAFLKNVKSHNGYYACERCTIKGIKCNGRTIYKFSENQERRSHVNFINKVDAGHHLGSTPLTKLKNFDMVFGFPLDYMHMACLGVMRRLLNFWFKADSQFRITPAFRREASLRIIQIATHTPREFGRRPRSFFELDRWKATEFRFFLLYVGVYVLKDILSSRQYKHFLYFVCAMRIICSREFCSTLGHIAITCIQKFCKEIGDVYDQNIEPIFNTHCVGHLVQDAVERNENPEDVNCFMFENYLGCLKKMIRTPNKPLAQVCKRIAEKKNCNKLLKNYNTSILSIVYEKRGDTIKAVNFKNMYIATKPKKESYILLSSKKIMSVNNIVKDNENNEILLYGSVFQVTENIFRHLIISSDLNMYQVKNLSSFQFSVTLNDIISKCIVFPLPESDYLGAVGLLHVNY